MTQRATPRFSTVGVGYALDIETPQPRPDQEEFGEARLGEAQSESPPADPEMIRTDADEGAGPPDDIERDPAYSPEDEDLKRLKGG